jgi:serine/threonine protein kinase
MNGDTKMLSPGQLIGNRYQVARLYNSGGMSQIYLAEDLRLRRQIVLKQMDRHYFPSEDRGWAQASFEREARLLARLHHPHLAVVYDFFTQEDFTYLVMEYVEGKTLGELLQESDRQRFDEEQVVTWGVELAKTLDYLHSQNPPVIFRDLKPQNVMLQPNGELKLIDFGIARLYAPQQATDTVSLGTPGYAAPEQYGLDQTDPRSDVYSLGVMLHELLSGYDPTKSLFDLPSLRDLDLDLSPCVIRAVDRATRLKREERFANMKEFAAALLDSRVATAQLGYPRVEPAQSMPPNPVKGGAGLFRRLFQWVATQVSSLEQGGGKVGRRERIPLSRKSEFGEDIPAKPFDRSTIQLNPTVKLRDDVVDELVLNADFERLHHFLLGETIASSQGYVLTGYGRFGGTSLVKSAIRKVRERVQRAGDGDDGDLLVVYLSPNDETTGDFKVHANGFSLGTVSTQQLTRDATRGSNGLTGVLPRKEQVRGYAFKGLLKTLFFSGDDEQSEDRIYDHLGSEPSQDDPIHRILILDRIQRIETLEALAARGLFDDQEQMTLVVTRQEDYDAWDNARQRLEAIGFDDWYIPCVWHHREGYMDDIRRILFTPDEAESEDGEHARHFLRHLEYQGRGTLGEILHQLKHPKYWSSTRRGQIYIDLDQLPDADSVQHNAWLQEVLTLNWATILGHSFVDEKQQDRARIGTYYLLDLIRKKVIFSEEQFLEEALDLSFALHDNDLVVYDVLRNLLWVLEQNHYISRHDHGHYRLCWERETPSAPEQVTRRPPPEPPTRETPTPDHGTDTRNEERAVPFEGIPGELYSRLRRGLARCATRSDLSSFTVDLVHPWRHLLAHEGSIEERVTRLINVLQDRMHMKYHANALVLYVRWLGQQKSEGDSCHTELLDLASELEAVVTPDDQE